MKRILTILMVTVLLAGCGGNGGGTDLRDAEAQALYDRAQRAMDRRDWTTATEELEALQAQFPFGDLATQAQLDLIRVYYETGEAASTVAAADRFRRLHPRHRAVPYTWYMQGLALQEKNEDFIKRLTRVDTNLRDPVPRRQAFQSFQTLVEQFPDSEYADDARERMRELYADGARFQLFVAEYYLNGEAWVAAARRAITVIEEFPGTPSVAPAMDVLTAAYRALGFDDLVEGVQVAAAEMDAVEPDQPAAPQLFEDESMEVSPSATDAPPPDSAPTPERTPGPGDTQQPGMPGPGAM